MESARESAERGYESTQRMLSAMGRITESSKQTSKIIKTIDEIAFLLGYANTPSFTRAFRAWAGVPPSEYRAREVGASG